MDDEEYAQRQGHFVEEVATLLEREGLPRMYGRVLGHLLVCQPPHQSSSELAEALNASRGAISTATRALVEAGLIQRKKQPGERSHYFEIRAETLQRLMHGSIARIRLGREVMDHGLDLLASRPEIPTDRVKAMRDIYRFMEREFPLLLERWDKRNRRETP